MQQEVHWGPTAAEEVRGAAQHPLVEQLVPGEWEEAAVRSGVAVRQALRQEPVREEMGRGGRRRGSKHA